MLYSGLYWLVVALLRLPKMLPNIPDGWVSAACSESPLLNAGGLGDRLGGLEGLDIVIAK